jgi:hypothetical protein
MQQYPQILLLFYRKVIAQHPQKAFLIRKLHSLLRRCQLEQQEEQTHMLAVSRRAPESPSKEADNHGQALKRQGLEWGVEWSFISPSFEQSLLFAVLSRLVEIEDFLGFKCLEEKLNELLEGSELE